MTPPENAAPRQHRWHEEPGGWSCACGVICDHEAEPCGRHGECKIGQRRQPGSAAWERPITEDFYRDPSGEWVYRWSDERLVLKEGPTDVDA